MQCGYLDILEHLKYAGGMVGTRYYILGSISRTIECVGAKTFSFVVCVAYGKAKRMSEMRLKCT